MRRNCNLELRLVPPSPFIFSDHHQPNTSPSLSEGIMNALGLGEDSNSSEKENQQLSELTIFYDGKISVCDVTELQARAIIKLAGEEIEEKGRKILGSTTSSEPSSPMISPLIGSQGGLSMKRSLQWFLQKRKHRIQANSPYHS